MSYDYNRAEFRSVKSPDSLATLYCHFVSLELALKEELGGVNNSTNGGHNIPLLLQKFTATSIRQEVISRKHHFKSLSAELRSKMKIIVCQDQYGACVDLPYYSYPYLRYVRHSSGKWTGRTSTSNQIASLNATVKKIIYSLEITGVQV